jgi:hypothetical protein
VGDATADQDSRAGFPGGFKDLGSDIEVWEWVRHN